MQIVKMKKEHHDEVLKMMRVFYDSPAILVKSSNEVLEKDFSDCISELPYLEGVVFEENNQIAGYSMISKCYTTEYGGICLYVEDIYLKEEYRRKGFTTALFNYLETNYPEAVRIKLEVEDENIPAIKTYSKNGLKVSEYKTMSKIINQT